MGLWKTPCDSLALTREMTQIYGSRILIAPLISPYTQFALRVCCKDWQANYDLLLSRCGISRLSSRRQFLKLCMLFNIFKDLIAYPCSPLSRRISPYPNRLPNPSQLATIHARLNIFKYSFFPSAIVAWNSLDFDTSNIHTLLSFKHALHNN